MNSESLLFWLQVSNTLIQILSLIFLIIYVVKTWQMASSTRKAAAATEATVKEMRDARSQDSSPYVIAYFDAPIGSRMLYLVVKNVGFSTAIDISLEFTPPLATSGKLLKEAPAFLEHGFPSMPPGYEYKTIIDSTLGYFNEETLPLTYEVTISYSGGLLEERRTDKIPLDLRALRSVVFTRRKDIHDLVETFDQFTRDHGRLWRVVEENKDDLEKGIHISNPTFTVVPGITTNGEEWDRLLTTRLKSFLFLWAKSYEPDRDSGLEIPRVQTAARLLSDQLFFLLASKPIELPTEIIDDLSAIALKLLQLAEFTLYMDGGKSLDTFNHLGDEVETLVRRVLAKRSVGDES